ncbi:MAG: hypothetical protein ACJAXM_001590 [Arenicella sp.]|jgi:hypothetical protein
MILRFSISLSMTAVCQPAASIMTTAYLSLRVSSDICLKCRHMIFLLSRGGNVCFCFTLSNTHCAKHIGLFEWLLLNHSRSCDCFCPYTSCHVLLTETSLILKPDIHVITRNPCGRFNLQIFLNAS